jgi:uncharacterized protein YcfJ
LHHFANLTDLGKKREICFQIIQNVTVVGQVVGWVVGKDVGHVVGRLLGLVVGDVAHEKINI